MGPKIIKASKLCVWKNEYTMHNICRNVYGDAIQVKYFEDSHDVAYFLSLHQKYFLIFLVTTNELGSLEVSLIKGISLPENEFTGTRREIVIAGKHQILIRDDSNAHEIEFETEINRDTLIDHTLPLKISTMEFIQIISSRKNISRELLNRHKEMLESPEHFPILDYALSFVDKYCDSVDISALRILFIAVFRYKSTKDEIHFDFLEQTLDYEVLTSARSDSQVKHAS